MTAPQILSVAAALDATWTAVAIAAWLSSAIALGAVLVWRWEDVREDALCVMAAASLRRSTGQHHVGGGRHRRGKLQGNPPPPPERLDGPPTTAPQPAPQGGAR